MIPFPPAPLTRHGANPLPRMCSLGDEEKIDSMEATTVYFPECGPQHTDETLGLARTRAEVLGIRDIVVASYTGATGAKAARLFSDHNLVVVGGVVGFREPNQTSMRAENQKVIEESGGKLFFSGHAFGMLGRAAHRRFGAIQIDELIAHVLRLFSQGVKVGCEIACMAADAGFVRSGAEIVAIAGSGSGADTAIVLRASNTHTFFDTRVLEIICKPRG
jgi:hypothetical protein